MQRLTAVRRALLRVLPLLALSACGDNITHTVTFRGIAALHEPISGATVALYDRSGAPIGPRDVRTNENGAFTISVRTPAAGYVVIAVSGGTFARSGEPFADRLSYVAEDPAERRHTFYHVGPFSNTVAEYRFAHPDRTGAACTETVRAFLGIANGIDLDNGLLFFARPLPPDLYWSLVQRFGGVGPLHAALTPFIDASPAGWASFVADNGGTTLLGAGESNLYSELGKELAKGAVSYVGGQAAGWLLSEAGLDSKGVTDVGQELAQILGALADLQSQLDNTTYDSVFRDLRNATNYFEDASEKLYHFSQNYPKAPCSNYQSDPTVHGYCVADLKELQDDLDRQNITTDLRTTNDDLVEPSGLVKNSLLGLFDKEAVTPHGKTYYAALERFMAYWLARQQLGLNLQIEKMHYQGNSPANVSAFLASYDGSMKQQAGVFLSLVEKNLAIDVVDVKDYTKSPVGKGYVPKVEKYGYCYGEPGWVAGNWSFYPDYTYSDHTDKSCFVEPATHDYVCDYFFTRSSSPFWNTSKPTSHATYSTPSPELGRADDLVFSKAIYTSTGTSLAARKPLVVRGYVVPLTHSLNLRFDHTLPWPSSDPTPQMIVTSTVDGAAHTAPAVLNTVVVPPVYYETKSPTHSWGSTGQYARFTFEDLSDGDYRLDTATMNERYSQRSGFGKLVFDWAFVADYYRGYTIAYAASAASRSPLLVLYSGGLEWRTQ